MSADLHEACEVLHITKARLQAQLAESCFMSLTAENELYDQLSAVCDRIDELELDADALAAKRWADMNNVPF